MEFVLWTGNQGLEIYEEIHVNLYNRLLHIAFLPFVFYAVFRGIPPLLTSEYKAYCYYILTIFQLCFYLFYYLYDCDNSISTVYAMLPMTILAIYQLRGNQSRKQHILASTILFIGSLVIQEVIGHSLWEQINSRITASYVTNAVLYSPMFYAQNQHYFNTYPITIIPTFILVTMTLYS
jgi:hypothetical protein